MANSINFSAALGLTGTGISLSGNGSTTATQAGTNSIEETLGLTTTTSQLTLGAIVNMGYLFVKNLDATNSVRISLSTPVTSGNAFATLQPGEFCFVPTRQTTIYGIAVAATPQILMVAVEL